MCTKKDAKVAIYMGSDSDYEVMKEAAKVLQEFGVDFTVSVGSAHRTPDDVAEFAKNAISRGYDIIIAGAGKAAHLPGVIASYTTIPVIGVPIKSSTMDGLDSLLSIVQMPAGIPVATVAIDGAKNAALLAVQILSISYDELGQKLLAYRNKLAEQVREKNLQLQKKISKV